MIRRIYDRTKFKFNQSIGKKPSAVKDRDIHAAIRILRREVPKWETPIVTLMAETYESPFRVLISCILSLRTQDSTTAKASHRLFAVADTPQAMVKLSAKKIEKLIYPVGFYKTKAKNILEICRTLIDQYDGKVPDEIDELLEVQRRRPQDRESGGHAWLQKTGHLRRHARASDFESLGLCQYENTGENRNRAARETSQAILDRIQRSAGEFRPAPVPADFSAFAASVRSKNIAGKSA